MPNKKFNIECTETTIYKFNVIADDEDQALEIAHDVLLGNDNVTGALRIEWPENAYFDADWNDRDWEVREADKDDTNAPVSVAMISDLDTPDLDTGLLITTENARTRLYENLPEDIEEASEDNPDAADDYVNDVIHYMCQNDKLKKTIAENLWDGSHFSSLVMNIIDNSFDSVINEYEANRKKDRQC